LGSISSLSSASPFKATGRERMSWSLCISSSLELAQPLPCACHGHTPPTLYAPPASSTCAATGEPCVAGELYAADIHALS
jgi:hypothetical protein